MTVCDVGMIRDAHTRAQRAHSANPLTLFAALFLRRSLLGQARRVRVTPSMTASFDTAVRPRSTQPQHAADLAPGIPGVTLSCAAANATLCCCYCCRLRTELLLLRRSAQTCFCCSSSTSIALARSSPLVASALSLKSACACASSASTTKRSTAAAASSSPCSLASLR